MQKTLLLQSSMFTVVSSIWLRWKLGYVQFHYVHLQGVLVQVSVNRDFKL